MATAKTTKERTGPLLLLDGMSLAFRAYFAPAGFARHHHRLVTNAVYGFSSMLVYLIREHRPSALAVAFDPPGDTFRDEMLEDYKAGRAETPGPPAPAVRHDPRGLAALAIPVVEAPGYEADDVIATLATEAAARESEVVIVTGDRDSFQLIQDPYVRVLYNKRGVSDYALYDEAGIEERSGVPPSQYVLLAALRGDPSDNLPGVPGVGEKTAARLLTTYGDLDGIYGHLDELTPKLRENLADNEHLVRSNARIIPLVATCRSRSTRRSSSSAVGTWGRRGRLRALRDEDGLAPARGAHGRRTARRARPGSAPGARAPGPASPPETAAATRIVPGFELQDVALPTSATEVTKRLGELGSGQARPGGPLERRAPGAASWPAWSWSPPRATRVGSAWRCPASCCRRHGGQGAQRAPGPTGARTPRQGGHALAPAAGRRRLGARDGHRGRGLPARRLDRRVRAVRICASRRDS